MHMKANEAVKVTKKILIANQEQSTVKATNWKSKAQLKIKLKQVLYSEFHTDIKNINVEGPKLLITLQGKKNIQTSFNKICCSDLDILEIEHCLQIQFNNLALAPGKSGHSLSQHSVGQNLADASASPKLNLSGHLPWFTPGQSRGQVPP